MVHYLLDTNLVSELARPQPNLKIGSIDKPALARQIQQTLPIGLPDLTGLRA